MKLCLTFYNQTAGGRVWRACECLIKKHWVIHNFLSAKRNEENSKTLAYKIRFIGIVRFMASAVKSVKSDYLSSLTVNLSLSNLTDNPLFFKPDW